MAILYAVSNVHDGHHFIVVLLSFFLHSLHVVSSAACGGRF